jgi:hypothetical protein
MPAVEPRGVIVAMAGLLTDHSTRAGVLPDLVATMTMRSSRAVIVTDVGNIASSSDGFV